MNIINEEIEWKIEQCKKFYLKTPQGSETALRLEGWLDALEWVLNISEKDGDFEFKSNNE